MDLLNTPKSMPIEPYINPDGWYAECYRCWHEIDPHNSICPYCQQAQDWSWYYNRNKTNKEG